MINSLQALRPFLRSAVLLFLAPTLLISGCASSLQKKGDWVADQWQSTMALYHAEPVYPPTADFHLGDLYAMALCDDDLTKTHPALKPCTTQKDIPFGTSVKIGHIDFRQDMIDYYSKIWPPEKKLVNALSKPTAASTFDYSILPFAALPGFTLSNMSAIDASASFPIQLFTGNLGAHRNKDEALTVRIEGVQIFELPASVADRRFREYCFNNADPLLQNICRQDRVKSLLRYQLGFYGSERPRVMVVTKIYTAKSITYSYSSDSSYGAQGKAMLGLSSNLLKIPTLPTQVVPKVVNTASGIVPAAAPALKGLSPAVNGVGSLGGAVSPVTETANDVLVNPLAAAMAATNKILKGAGGPGVTLSYTAVSEEGVSITETFDRPVVIGYRGIQISAATAEMDP